MRMSLLLQREPCGQILERTLARFWSEGRAQAVKVRWLPGSALGRQAGGAGHYH